MVKIWCSRVFASIVELWIWFVKLLNILGNDVIIFLLVFSTWTLCMLEFVLLDSGQSMAVGKRRAAFSSCLS